MHKFTVGLLGAAAVVASVFVLRQPRPAPPQGQSADSRTVPAGERVPSQISLDRIRELGF